MNERRVYVVDASVVTKWFLRDEQHLSEALAVRGDFQEGHTSLAAPLHVRHEVGSAIFNRATRQPSSPGSRVIRITDNEAREHIRNLLGRPIRLIEDWQLFALAFEIGKAAPCSFYDGHYLAAAVSLGVPLIHAERKFRSFSVDVLPHQIWIADYPASRVSS